MDEADLIARLQSGDEEAYAWLVRQHSPRMLSVARRLLRCDDLAREAVQQAFVSAFRGIAHFRAGSQVSTWMHRIVVNAALMMLRQRRQRPETSIEGLLPTWEADGHRIVDPAAGHVPADVELERAETRARVRAAIGCLPDTYRVALMLRDIEEMEIADAATALGITPNAFKIRVHRAWQALLTLLTHPDSRPVARELQTT